MTPGDSTNLKWCTLPGSSSTSTSTSCMHIYSFCTRLFRGRQVEHAGPGPVKPDMQPGSVSASTSTSCTHILLCTRLFRGRQGRQAQHASVGPVKPDMQHGWSLTALLYSQQHRQWLCLHPPAPPARPAHQGEHAGQRHVKGMKVMKGRQEKAEKEPHFINSHPPCPRAACMHRCAVGQLSSPPRQVALMWAQG